jgi:peptide/nickel transport system permease protein
MLWYTLKRLLLLLPTLLVVSLLAFGLSRLGPGDPVDNFLPPGDAAQATPRALAAYEREYREIARQLGQDLPAFYFRFGVAAIPDTLYRVQPLVKRRTLRQLLRTNGNWPDLQRYYQEVDAARRALLASGATGVAYNRLRGGLERLYFLEEPARHFRQLDSLFVQSRRDSLLAGAMATPLEQLAAAFRTWHEQPATARLYTPHFHWYGTKNQYHRWATGLLRGDLGTSFRSTQLPVAQLIGEAIGWTLILNGLAIAIAFGLAIPLGVALARRAGSRFDRWTSVGLFLLFSLPNFWMATILSVLFTTPEYGMNLFPALGVYSPPPGTAWWASAFRQIPYLTLPVFCLSYGALAYIARQMRRATLAELGKDYVRTARAKGMGERRVVWRHAVRNSLFPIITLFAGVLPGALAGSVIIENIFRIPGIGKLTFDSVIAKDWPVVFSLVLLAGVLTILGILIADLLYAWLDPRVRLGAKKRSA